MTLIFARRGRWLRAFSGLVLMWALPARSADLSWKNLDWDVTDGGMAGVAEGSPSNVSLDSNGWLHLKVTKNGNAWTASELFTTQKLGFGTYQWQIEGPIDTFDKNIVLGLFPYGPAAGIGDDGTNEIDIEFSRWGIASAPNADFTDYPASGKVVGETTFTFSLGGSTSATARFTWNATSIESSVLQGHQAIGSETGLLKKWKYAPANANVNIPQRALPLGMNLWCFDAPPSDGQNVEIVIRDFQFVKEGDPLPSGGSGGAPNGGSGGIANGGAGGAPLGGAANGGASSAAAGGAANGGAGSPGADGGMLAAGGNLAVNGGSLPMSTSSAGTPSAGSDSRANAGGSPVAGTGDPVGGAADNAEGPKSESSCTCQAAGASPPSAAFPGLFGLALLLRRRGDRAAGSGGVRRSTGRCRRDRRQCIR